MQAEKEICQMMRAVVAAVEDHNGPLFVGIGSMTVEGDEYCLTLCRLDDLRPISANDAGPDFPITND